MFLKSLPQDMPTASMKVTLENCCLNYVSSAVSEITALGETILNIENNYDFMTLKYIIDEMLPETDQRLKTVIIIILFYA